MNDLIGQQVQVWNAVEKEWGTDCAIFGGFQVVYSEVRVVVIYTEMPKEGQMEIWKYDQVRFLNPDSIGGSK